MTSPIEALGLLKYLNRDALTAEGLQEITSTLGITVPVTELAKTADVIRTRGITEGVIRLVPYWAQKKGDPSKDAVNVMHCPVCDSLVTIPNKS